MTLQNKTLLIILSCFIGTIGTIYLISGVIVTDSFQELENSYARDNTVRVQEVLNNEISNLSITAGTFATTISSIISGEHPVSGSQKGVNINRPADGQLDLLFFYDSISGHTGGWFVDPDNPQSESLPPEWDTPLSGEHPLYIPRSTSGRSQGLIKLKDGRVLMAAARPFSALVDNQRHTGTVIAGNILDSSQIQQITRVSKLSLRLVNLDNITVEDPNYAFFNSLDVNAPNPVRIQNESLINGYILLRDVFNQPIHVLIVSFPRDIYQQGQAVLGYFAKLLIIVGIVTVVIILLLINQVVLSRLNRLRTGMINVYNTGDLTSHVKLDGNDELKELVDIFNNLLDSLKTSQSELEQQINERLAAEQEIQLSRERFNRAELIGKLGHWEWDEINNRMIACSEQFALIYGESVGQILGRFSSRERELETVHPDDRERVRKELAEMKSSLKGMDIEYRIYTCNGELRHVQRISEPVINNDGVLVRSIGTLQDITRQKQVQDRLRMYQNHLRSVMSKLALAEEQERRRIAAELHDSTIQDLGLLKFRLSAFLKTIKEKPASENLSEILDLLDKAINDTRTLVFELSPPILYDIGFVPALEWLAEQFHLQRGLSCEVLDDGQEKPLDTSMMVILFQIVRELLINISKHAGASRASISIYHENDMITINVQDNGKGFDTGKIDDPTGHMEGFGLFSIRERINSIDGKMTIESTPGKGTAISISAPLGLQSDEPNEKESYYR